MVGQMIDLKCPTNFTFWAETASAFKTKQELLSLQIQNLWKGKVLMKSLNISLSSS